MEHHALLVFLFAFLLRYLRVFVGIAVNLRRGGVLVPEHPTYTAQDVAVVVPTTFNNTVEFIHCLTGISRAQPAQIIVVTANSKTAAVKKLLAANALVDILVLGVEKLNKRAQILAALLHVTGAITVLADDDVVWPVDYLRYLLAVFEDPAVGAGGTCQRVRREVHPTAMNFLGIAYLERRVWNNLTTNAIDGSISTLSGRTAAYRTAILATAEFQHYFTHDSWFGRPLNSDDDKCLTRYVYSHGWAIKIQADRHAVIETTVEQAPAKYLAQCMRWARAHWRGNLTVMTNETYWRAPRFGWGCFVIYGCQFMTPAAVVDGVLAWLLTCAIQESGWTGSAAWSAYACFAAWVLFTKIVKLIPHLCKYPSDVRFLPAAVLFSYFHGLVNVYALLTLNVTHWGSQQLSEPAAAKTTSEPAMLANGKLQHAALIENKAVPSSVPMVREPASSTHRPRAETQSSDADFGHSLLHYRFAMPVLSRDGF